MKDKYLSVVRPCNLCKVYYNVLRDEHTDCACWFLPVTNEEYHKVMISWENVPDMFRPRWGEGSKR